jgi:hypothetical protein
MEHFFYLSFLPKILQIRVKIKYNLNPKIPAHVFIHPLITKHEKRITQLKYSNEKQYKLLVLEQRSFFLQKTEKFLAHKNIFTHSFVGIELGVRKM